MDGVKRKKKKTPEQYQRMLADNVRRYWWLKEHGICTRCAARDAIEGMTRCAECTAKEKQYQIQRYHARKEHEA